MITPVPKRRTIKPDINSEDQVIRSTGAEPTLSSDSLHASCAYLAASVASSIVSKLCLAGRPTSYEHVERLFHGWPFATTFAIRLRKSSKNLSVRGLFINRTCCYYRYSLGFATINKGSEGVKGPWKEVLVPSKIPRSDA